MHSIYLSHLAWKPQKRGLANIGKRLSHNSLSTLRMFYIILQCRWKFESAHYSWLFCSRETTHSVRKNTKYSRRNSVRPEKVQAHKVLYQKWHFMFAWFYKQHIWYHIIQYVHFILYCIIFLLDLAYVPCIKSMYQGDHRTLFKQKPCALFCGNTWQAPPSRPALWWLGQARHSR